MTRCFTWTKYFITIMVHVDAVGLRLHTEERSCHHKVKEHKDSVNRQLSILDDVLHQYCESSWKPGQLLLMSCHLSFCSRNPKWRYGSFLMFPCIRLSEMHLIKRNKDQIGQFCPYILIKAASGSHPISYLLSEFEVFSHTLPQSFPGESCWSGSPEKRFEKNIQSDIFIQEASGKCVIRMLLRGS